MGHLHRFSVFVLACLAPTLALALEPADRNVPFVGTAGPRLAAPLGVAGDNLVPPTALGFAPQELQLPPRARILVFAPHPDDETLGTGGLLQQALAQGATVHVVVMTNGDGYVDGVVHHTHHAPPSSAEFRAYGSMRRDEAVTAVQRLGLTAEDVEFLSFPDGGLDDLWADYWSDDRPYVSPFTQLSRPPGAPSQRSELEYVGNDLVEAVEAKIRSFRPTIIVTPDPRDQHPDHCSTAVFVLDALRRVRQESNDKIGNVRVLGYLVHMTDYPSSPTWSRRLIGMGVGGTPTAWRSLSNTPWVHVAVSPSQQARKSSALGAYRSQYEVMAGFLQQFVRPYELFSELGEAQIVSVPTEFAASVRKPAPSHLH